MTQHILITGNPVDGFAFTGPFTYPEDASEAGEASQTDWWLGVLEPSDQAARVLAGGGPMNTAKGWMTEPVRGFFRGEISNERNGGVSPSTLSSAIDSLAQGGMDTFALGERDLMTLLKLADLVGTNTHLEDLL